jgi:hypothetical protein
MQFNPGALLVRITDLLYSPTPTIGAALGTAPGHHIVMENILYGKSNCAKDDQEQWETYDLKPNDYFYPERDVAGGRLAPDSVKERLIDEFPDKVRLTIDEKEDLVAQITTMFLFRPAKARHGGRGLPPAMVNGCIGLFSWTFSGQKTRSRRWQ